MICRFCQDRGCLCCAGERLRHQRRAAQPIFVAQTDNPDHLALLRKYFGADALNEIAEKANGDPAEFNLHLHLNAFRALVAQEKLESGDGSGGE